LLDLLGLGGVSIERVDELPAVSPPGDLGLGVEVPPDQAGREAFFALLVPDEEEWGEPDQAFVSTSVPGGMVSLLYGTEERVRLLVTQFRGRAEPDLVKKAVGEGTSLEFLTVRGKEGFWLAGNPHAVLFRDVNGELRDEAFRLAANVLVWVESGITIRLEGDFDRETAIRIAESLR
ncbi:MAG: hypothetical protein ACRDM9_08130, partial [Gaiellaceae bacterium]